MLGEAQTLMKGADRNLEDVLPSDSKLYRAKEAVRQAETEWAPTPELKDEMRQKILQRRYFELNDTKKVAPQDAANWDQQLEKVQADYQKLSQILPDGAYFQLPTEDQLNQASKALEDALKANPELRGQMDPEALRKAQEGLRQALPILQKLKEGSIPKTGLPPMDPATVKKLAPYYTGPSNHAPAEKPATVRKLAPYYAGPSNH
jgi:hypothetical protein